MTIYIFYIVSIFAHAAILNLTQKNKNLMLFFLFCQLTFISGFRKSIGGDTQVYVELFRNIRNLDLQNTLSLGYESGFLLYCYLLSRLFQDPQAIIFATSTIINFIIFLQIYKRSRMPWLSVLLYFTLLYYFNFMNLMRFGIASSILFVSVDYLKDGKPIKFIILVLIASSFHISSIIFLFVYPLRTIKITRISLMIIIFLLALLSQLIGLVTIVIPQIWPRYISYLEAFNRFQGNLANYINAAVNTVLFLFAIRYDKKNIKTGNIDILLLAIATGISILAIKVMILTRYSILFSIVAITYLPNILSEIKSDAKVIYTYLVSLLSFLYLVIILAYRPDWFLLTPYKSVLFSSF